jgi:hypothetical protein
MASILARRSGCTDCIIKEEIEIVLHPNSMTGKKASPSGSHRSPLLLPEGIDEGIFTKQKHQFSYQGPNKGLLFLSS